MSQIIPPKVINGVLDSISERDMWTEDDGSGSSSQYGYTFDIKLAIVVQNHFCEFTRTPYQYDGLDVTVGMWIGAERGRALQITSIDSVRSTSDTLYCVGEDVDRYNLINDPDTSGSGGLPQGLPVYIFSLSNDGLPILSPIVSTNFSQTFVSDMTGRFIGRNPDDEFIDIQQPSHSMAVGDVIRPDLANPGQFVKALGDQYVNQIVGIVTQINVPGHDYFSFRPIGKKIDDVSPELVGNPGDIFYVSTTDAGKFTKTKPNAYAKPIYLRLNTSTSAIILNASSNSLETYKLTVSPTDGQTAFTFPGIYVQEILTMAVNGIECTDWAFDIETQTLTYQASDYAIDSSDQVLIVYKA